MTTKLLAIVSTVLFAMFSSAPAAAHPRDDYVDPFVETVVSGPAVLRSEAEGTVQHRLISIRSEIYLSLIVQRVEFGPEGSSPRVVKSIELDAERLEGAHRLFQLHDVQWVDFGTLEFTANSTKYRVTGLSTAVGIERLSERDESKQAK